MKRAATPQIQNFSKLKLLIFSFVAAVCLHWGPLFFEMTVDEQFRLDTQSWLVLFSLCLFQMSVTTLPGRVGTFVARVFLGVFAVTVVCNLMTLSVFHHPITFIVLSTTIQSNVQEAREFMATYGPRFFWGAGVGLALAALAIFLHTRAMRPRTLRPALTALILSITCAAPLLYDADGDFKQLAHTYHQRAYANRLVTTGVRYQAIMSERGNAQTFWNQHLAHSASVPLRPIPYQPQPDVLVVVLGESTTRRHMGIYGYRRPTTPILQSMKNQLVIVRNAISPMANTLPAVLGSLCSGDFDPDTLNCGGHTLLEVAKAGGYRTVWISNQVPIGFGDNFIAELGRTADTSVFVNTAVSSGGEADNSISLDEKVLEPLDAQLRSVVAHPKKTMVLIHLMGTHFVYDKRYPHHWQIFNDADEVTNRLASTEQAKKLVNRYDNAVAYQDKILGEIVTRLNHSGLRAVMVYFSDHGDEVYDTEGFAGHSEDRPTPAMREVPFIVAFSPNYQREQREQWELLKSREHLPFSTLQVTPTVAALLGLELGPVHRFNGSFSPFPSGQHASTEPSE